MKTATRQWIGLGVSIVICFVPAAIGSAFTPGSPQGGYAQLAKPVWTPPSWLFGPVWTALYLSMGVAAWLVWRERGFAGAKLALGLFAGQLALNAAWSPVFFGLRNPAAAFAVIVPLWLAIGATTVAFFRAARPAGWLMLPYWLWVSFATALNFAIWRMNP